jgi:protein ImuB
MPLWIALRPTLPEPEAALQALLISASAVTSHATVHDNHTVLLDVQASVAFFGGIRALRRQLIESLNVKHIPLSASFACSAVGAWLLAQRPRSPAGLSKHWRFALSSRRLLERLGRLPVADLGPARPYLSWLQGLGCVRLEQLLALPRHELARRTTPALLQILDLAFGNVPFLYSPHQLPPHFRQRVELSYRVQAFEQLSYPLTELLKGFCQWLAKRRLAVRRFQCRLHHHERRRAHSPTMVQVGLSEPGWQLAVLSTLLTARLQNTPLPASVTAITLTSEDLCPQPVSSGVLFETTATQAHHSLRTLDLLRARLGHAAVRQPQPREDWRPEYANQWNSDILQDSQPAVIAASGPHSPAWLLPTPKSLQVKDNRPWFNGPLRLQQGPYRIETGWWNSEFALRDYFVASDQQSRRYWIYRERDKVAARWFLHGLFG